MNFEVAPEFERALKKLGKKYHSLKNDYLTFLSELEKNPMLGDELFPNCRKVRIAIKSKSEMENVQNEFIE
ncbi:MAG: hypothetical protein LBN93_05240 [Candidatus Symbiothrix sp.]|jgi:mRNA-degrading endonuclease RelE of RelBE toxin-antitoxin system|nr:hypothetical protein [Candidatus Symbiothrix sp.]